MFFATDMTDRQYLAKILNANRVVCFSVVLVLMIVVTDYFTTSNWGFITVFIPQIVPGSDLDVFFSVIFFVGFTIASYYLTRLMDFDCPKNIIPTAFLCINLIALILYSSEAGVSVMLVCAVLLNLVLIAIRTAFDGYHH
jgi:Na+/melibiose symporter-like transporter